VQQKSCSGIHHGLSFRGDQIHTKRRWAALFRCCSGFCSAKHDHSAVSREQNISGAQPHVHSENQVHKIRSNVSIEYMRFMLLEIALSCRILWFTIRRREESRPGRFQFSDFRRVSFYLRCLNVRCTPESLSEESFMDIPRGDYSHRTCFHPRSWGSCVSDPRNRTRFLSLTGMWWEADFLLILY